MIEISATGNPMPAHGTRARYLSRQGRCRCADCRAANAAYMADYRRQHRTAIAGQRRRSRARKKAAAMTQTAIVITLPGSSAEVLVRYTGEHLDPTRLAVDVRPFAAATWEPVAGERVDIRLE